MHTVDDGFKLTSNMRCLLGVKLQFYSAKLYCVSG
jgi:hypothetical protein